MQLRVGQERRSGWHGIGLDAWHRNRHLDLDRRRQAVGAAGQQQYD